MLSHDKNITNMCMLTKCKHLNSKSQWSWCTFSQ